MHPRGGSMMRGGRGRGPAPRGPNYDSRPSNGSHHQYRSIGNSNGGRAISRGGGNDSWGGGNDRGHDRGMDRGIDRGMDRGMDRGGGNERGGGGGGGPARGSWGRDQTGPPPRGRALPRDSNRGSRLSSRGGQSQPRREFGVRGLGNKEEIPHDLKPVDWASQTMEEINRVHYNVRYFPLINFLLSYILTDTVCSAYFNTILFHRTVTPSCR